jgi:hypothetical protein
LLKKYAYGDFLYQKSQILFMEQLGSLCSEPGGGGGVDKAVIRHGGGDGGPGMVREVRPEGTS